MARKALEDKKAEQVVVLDVRKVSTVTDYFVICTGNNGPHIRAMGEEVGYQLKQQGISCFHKAGTAESEWVVVDYIDVVVHIFSAQTREYYALEELWKDAPLVEDAATT